MNLWAIGGGILVGFGVGFFFLHVSALFFVGSLIAGLGLGLIAAAILSTCILRKNSKWGS
jgi:hypothetical protein